MSRASEELDELESWLNRERDAFPYVYLEARYEKIRHGGVIIAYLVLVAVGVDSKGKCEVLGVSVSLSEQEMHWRQFHLQQNAQGYVPRRDMEKEVADRIWAIFDAPDIKEALRLL